MSPSKPTLVIPMYYTYLTDKTLAMQETDEDENDKSYLCDNRYFVMKDIL